MLICEALRRKLLIKLVYKLPLRCSCSANFLLALRREPFILT